MPPSSSNQDPRQWNAIWKLDLPEKIKIFMSMAVKNLLPTAENLWRRKIVPDPICQRCKRGVETSIHAMVECKAARKIRQLSLIAAVEITASQGWNIWCISWYNKAPEQKGDRVGGCILVGYVERKRPFPLQKGKIGCFNLSCQSWRCSRSL